MEAFEQLVSELLWAEGYWVRTSVRVQLTKPEKKRIGRPSSPRWELDIVAYSGRDNMLRVVECKSYLDSGGVALRAFNGKDRRFAERFKLFLDAKLRRVVFARLCKQFTGVGACRSRPAVRLCLACGRIASDADRKGLRKLFGEKGWELLDEEWIRQRLRAMSHGSYENQMGAVVTKLLLRERSEAPREGRSRAPRSGRRA
jgi:hypothetical protein